MRDQIVAAAFNTLCRKGAQLVKHKKLCYLILGSVMLFVPPAATAQVQDVSAGLAKGIWTAETIRAIRANKDYKTLMALVLADAGIKAKVYQSSDTLNQAIVKARQLIETTPRVSLDPDFNPATFRQMLRELHNQGVLSADVLKQLEKELSRSPSDLSAEQLILGEDAVATKATFATFMQNHVMAAYDVADDARVRSIISGVVRDSQLPDVRASVTTLINQSHLPEGDVKGAILEIANTGGVDPDKLVSAAKAALTTEVAHFSDARSTFQSIVSGQPHFDAQILTTGVSPELAVRVAAAKKLISSSPDQLEQFDTLQTVASLLPLPPNISNTIHTVAQIGSTIESTVSTVSQVASSLSALGNIANIGMSFLTTGGIGALAGSLSSVLGGGGPSNAEILEAVNRVGQEVQQMHAQMISRFDQVDRELGEINTKLDVGFAALGAQLADVQIDLRALASTASSIEQIVINERDTLERSMINNIGAWTDNELKELDNNLVELLAAVDRADAHSDDMKVENFRRLAQYFTILARTGAAKRPLNGLQAADKYDLGFAAPRLSRESGLYPVNYTMSFPIEGEGNQTLQSLLSGPEAARDISSRAYVNERVWAMAANAIALMVERWPAFAREIPSLRVGFDGIVNNGNDLASLAKGLQQPQTLPYPVPLSKPFFAVLREYERHTFAFRGALRDALHDEARNFASDEKLNQEQAAALISALWDGRRNDARADALGVLAYPFVLQQIKYSPPVLNLSGCNGEHVAQQFSRSQLSGPAFSTVGQSLALNTGVLSACVTIPAYVTERQANVKDHGGYGVEGQGAPCAADSLVTFRTLEVSVRLMFRLASDPDDAAHRIVIGEAHVEGPEAETNKKIIARPHWSGQATEAGHEWNLECQVIWQVGDADGAYIGDDAYINSNWGTLSAGFSPVYYSDKSFSLAAGSAADVLRRMRSQDEAKLFRIYTNFFEDLTAVLQKPLDPPKTRITNPVPILDEIRALEGLRELLRSLTTIGFEETLARDDVLSGILFGTEELPGAKELLDSASVCAHGHFQKTVDNCLVDFATLPTDRATRLEQRVSLITTNIKAGKAADSHQLLDKTLDRLNKDHCLVPETYGGKADCNVQ